MNLYNYLMMKTAPNDTTRAAKEAKEAYERFQARRQRQLPQPEDADPFAFAYVGHGYQAFTFRPDQIVDAEGELAVVTGWDETSSGWKVRAKTAKGEFHWNAEDLKPAVFPEGLVEILRGRVHDKVDGAFA